MSELIPGIDIDMIFGWASGLITFGIILFVIVGGAIFLWWSGLLVRRPYVVDVLTRQAGGGFNPPKKATGRHIKQGKTGEFEIFYGIGDKVLVSGLKENQILGNKIFCLRIDAQTHIFLTPIIEDENLQLDPALDPAARLAYVHESKEVVRAFAKPNLLEKFALPLALIVCAGLLGITYLIGVGEITSAFEKSMDTVIQNNQLLSDSIENMQRLIDYQEEQIAKMPAQRPAG